MGLPYIDPQSTTPIDMAYIWQSRESCLGSSIGGAIIRSNSSQCVNVASRRGTTTQSAPRNGSGSGRMNERDMTKPRGDPSGTASVFK